MQHFRENLRKHRKMSQTALAERMSKRGHAFRQQTIQKIESGGRPVSLEEAIDLAGELGVSLETLTAPQAATNSYKRLLQIRAKVFSLIERAVRAEVEWFNMFPDMRELCLELDGSGMEDQLTGDDRELYLALLADLRKWTAASSPSEGFRIACEAPSEADGLL